MLGVRLLLFGLAGLAFGSFLTVVAHRTPLRESVGGRSRCPTCGSRIQPRDNIPVVSWVLLRGRCRHCGARISVEYPLAELGTTGLFLGAALAFDDVYVAALMAVFLGLLLAVALTDLHARLVPNAVVYPSLVLFAAVLAVGALLGRHVDLAAAGLGFAAFGGGMLLVSLLRPTAMGMGDVKLAGLIGLVLGSQGLRYVAVAAGVGVLVGAAGALGALAAGRSRKSQIPFAPFLVIGAAVAAMWAGPVAHWYLSSLR